jgi:hypothetical protein
MEMALLRTLENPKATRKPRVPKALRPEPVNEIKEIVDPLTRVKERLKVETLWSKMSPHTRREVSLEQDEFTRQFQNKYPSMRSHK